MSLLPGIIPPTRETWEMVMFWFQLLPVFASAQWFTNFYPMGKTSIETRFNIPGKVGWATMEAPGFILLLVIMFTLPPQLGLTDVSNQDGLYRGLPPANWAMAGMFTIHYIYRSLLYPYMQPSMSPIHPVLWASALSFQICNAISIGGWLAGYGPVTLTEWAGSLYRAEVGMVIWGWGLLANAFHDDDLREIRRAASRRQRKQAEEKAKLENKPVEEVSVDKIYMVPKNGLFHFVLYPHYLCEWIEWAGFWLVGGWACAPARIFLVNEIAAMLPRAVNGKKWYVEKFGKERIGNRRAVIPWLV